MKQRFSSLDVTVVASELSRALCTLRLSNIYDLSPRIFLLKFAKPDHRSSLLIDVGFRCHLTDFVRETASSPSSFVTRMRKFLRSRRVTSVSQIGTDRIIELQFSDGQYRLFFEFYAGGNIVLTTGDLSIIALFRMVPEGPNQAELRVGLRYSLDHCQNLTGAPPLTSHRVRIGLQKVLDVNQGACDIPVSLKKFKRKPGDALRKALSASFSEYPPILLDHAMHVAEFDIMTPIEDVLGNEDFFDKLLRGLREAQRIKEGMSGPSISKGYIIAKTVERGHTQHHDEQSHAPMDTQRDGLIYEDFQPFRPRQFERSSAIKILEFEGFNRTVDEFFSSTESQKLESRLAEKEQHASKKLETAKQDHQRRLGGLQEAQQLNVRKAQAIEANLQKVQEAIIAVNALVAQSIGWPEIARLIEIEQQRHNSVAEMVKLPLKLHENTVTLFLTEIDFEDEADFEGNETDSEASDSQGEDYQPHKLDSVAKPEEKRLAVDVDLGLSPWSNARQYYDQKKTAANKEQRTMQSSEKALRNTERKINADLKKSLKQEREVLRPKRTPFWFEKFIYFISSDGYLVLGGKDAQQSDILYKRYLAKGDAYVHADLEGAASTVIKNKPGKFENPIPPSTLSQAGVMAVCTSSAWESKAVMSAWWVNADQVSKINQIGEFLPPGVFTIKGQKNFLPPAHLLLGFGLMFKISEDSKARHFKHRLTFEPETPTKGMHDADDRSDPQSLKIENSASPSETVRVSDDRNAHSMEVGENEKRFIETHTYIHDETERSQNDEEADSNYFDLLQSNDAKSDVSNLATAAAVNLCSGDRQGEDESNVITGNAAEEKLHKFKEGEPESSEITGKSTYGSNRHISARQRKNMRKSQQSHMPEEEPEISNPVSEKQKSASPERETNTQETQRNQVRGKKSKREKVKTKYADQDDEERALAMRLIGSASAHERAQEKIEANATKERDEAAQKERRRKQHATKVEQSKEAEENRRRNFEGSPENDIVEPETVEDLEAFVGTVFPGDEILDALVMCGPWDAVGSKCKWKAKLQPGSVKKGKAIKEILEAWGASSKAMDKKPQSDTRGDGENTVEQAMTRGREAELIAAIHEPEIVGAVPVGKVRVTLGTLEGGSKVRGSGAVGRGKRGGKGSKRN